MKTGRSIVFYAWLALALQAGLLAMVERTCHISSPSRTGPVVREMTGSQS